MYSYITFVLQLKNISKLDNHTLANSSSAFNANIDSLLQNSSFTSICKRYTKAMAIKHWLQNHMFNQSDEYLINAVISLETAAFRLQQIQVSSLTRTIIIANNLLHTCFSNFRSYIPIDLAWNLHQDST